MVKNLFLNKDIFKNKFKYYLLKIAPKGFIVSIELKNNFKIHNEDEILFDNKLNMIYASK